MRRADGPRQEPAFVLGPYDVLLAGVIEIAGHPARRLRRYVQLSRGRLRKRIGRGMQERVVPADLAVDVEQAAVVVVGLEGPGRDRLDLSLVGAVEGRQ